MIFKGISLKIKHNQGGDTVNKGIFDKILDAQEMLSAKPEYENLMKEYELRNKRFLEQVKTMNPEQQSAVWDYCGMLIEMHLHTLEIIAS